MVAVVMSLINKKRNYLPGLEEIKEIAINNQSSEANEMACLIKQFGGKKYNGLDTAKVEFYSKNKKGIEYFKKRVSGGGVLTFCLSDQGVNGKDFNSKQEVIDYFEVKKSRVGQVFLYDTEKVSVNSSMTDHYFFGKTFADTKAEIKIKNGSKLKQKETFQEFCTEFKKKISEITKALIDFDGKRKIINDGLIDMLTLACVESEDHNTIVKPIALMKGVDVLYHRGGKRGGNFISFSPKGEKFLPTILDELKKEEKKCKVEKNLGSTEAEGSWLTTNNVIHTIHGGRTEMKFARVFGVIEKVAKKGIEPKKESKTHAELHMH